MNKLTDNVMEFLDKASVLHSKFEEDRFSQEMFCNCLEVGMQSPIEHLFWIAVHALCHANYVDVNCEAKYSKTGELELDAGIYITTQAKIGNYSVDFVLDQIGIMPDHMTTKIVVELDGHDFHDKDKKQRAYEKSRDRFLVKKGYKVLHFTGSEVFSDPFKVAHEALDMLSAFCGSGKTEYNPNDPLGLEM